MTPQGDINCSLRRLMSVTLAMLLSGVSALGFLAMTFQAKAAPAQTHASRR